MINKLKLKRNALSLSLAMILGIFILIPLAQAATLDTVYYQTIINTEGSLTFKNKNTGAIILTSSTQYYLN